MVRQDEREVEFGGQRRQRRDHQKEGEAADVRGVLRLEGVDVEAEEARREER